MAAPDPVRRAVRRASIIAGRLRVVDDARSRSRPRAPRRSARCSGGRPPAARRVSAVGSPWSALWIAFVDVEELVARRAMIRHSTSSPTSAHQRHERVDGSPPRRRRTPSRRGARSRLPRSGSASRRISSISPRDDDGRVVRERLVADVDELQHQRPPRIAIPFPGAQSFESFTKRSREPPPSRAPDLDLVGERPDDRDPETAFLELVRRR